MLDYIIQSIFKFISYVFFGFTMEICFVAIAHLLDGKITNEDKRLTGKTYLWMIPIYGFLLLFPFEISFKLIHEWPIYFRFIFWAITFTFFEGISGWGYDRWLGFCPWDYSDSKFKVHPSGYTKWTLLPAWGIAGLIIEQYSKLIVYLSYYVPVYIKGII